MPYPVSFDIQPPERFDKTHVFIRILIVVILSMFGGVIGWLLGAVYLVFPVVAAIMISQKRAERFHEEGENNITKWLRYVVASYAYMGFLTDRLPNEDPNQTFQLSIRSTGTPTPGSALLRIIMGLPSAIVLGIIGLAFIVVIPVAAISILINGTYPEWAYNFTRGYMRWEARLLAYVSSLVDEYPPFSFDAGEALSPGDQPPAASPSEPPE